MKLIELKIKRMSLAAESQLIRREEQKALRHGRFCNALASEGITIKRLDKLGLTNAQKVRVMRRRTANTPTFPVIDAMLESYSLYRNLRDHRTKDVRDAARAAHLAHHYLKGDAFHIVEDRFNTGMTQKQLEQGVAAIPHLRVLATNVARDVRTFGGSVNKDVKPKDIEYWMEGNPTVAQEADLLMQKAALLAASTAVDTEAAV